jgi:hypothetical protein
LLGNGTPATSNTNHPPAVAESPFSHLHLPVSRSSATSNVVWLDERVIRKVAPTGCISRYGEVSFAETHRYGDATAKRRHSPGTPFSS